MREIWCLVMVTHAVSDFFSSLGENAEYLAFCFMFKNSVILPSKQQTGKVSQQSSPCASTHEFPCKWITGEIELWCCVMTTKQAAHMTFRPETNNCILNISVFKTFVCVCVKSDCAGEHEGWCHILLQAWCGALFSATLGEVPPVCVILSCFHAGLWKDIFSTLGSCALFFVSFLCHFPLPFLSWLDSISGKVNGGSGRGRIDFSITTL